MQAIIIREYTINLDNMNSMHSYEYDGDWYLEINYPDNTDSFSFESEGECNFYVEKINGLISAIDFNYIKESNEKRIKNGYNISDPTNLDNFPKVKA